MTQRQHTLEEQLHHAEGALGQTRRELQNNTLQLQQIQSALSASQGREDELEKAQEAALTAEQSRVHALQVELDTAQRESEKTSREISELKNKIASCVEEKEEQQQLYQKSAQLLKQKEQVIISAVTLLMLTLWSVFIKNTI